MDGPLEVLVSKDSATSCRSWERGPEHICALARTPSELVKFAPNDADFDMVSQKIRDVTKRCLERDQSRKASTLGMS